MAAGALEVRARYLSTDRMNARQLTLTCACGWEVSGTEDEVVAAAQDHGRTMHNMETSREQVLALAKVIPPD